MEKNRTNGQDALVVKETPLLLHYKICIFLIGVGKMCFK